ncbi:protein HflC [Kordiimonas sediminis]|uniref:Protein HflC n=1 Tax=Kordiimonas sediminis TaxID=1735581 RepID=A0A919E998_9PROT|nr:protease modulator HflC [Kordiimonas sediminis]GHF30729.1 protein HflC [Kordiimonas sediminis]
MKKPLIALVTIVAVVVIFGLASVFTVNEREQAIVVQFGEPKATVVEPGLHFKTPFLEQVTYLDKRILSLDIRPQEMLASDQRRIVVDSFARFRIVDPLKTYTAARTEYRAMGLLEKVMEASVREVLAKRPMQDIVSGERRNLMQQIAEITNAQASAFGLEVVDVRLKRVDLPMQNSQSIFDRMRSERNREATQKRSEGQGAATRIRAEAEKERTILLAEAEKQSSIIRGEGDGEAVRIFGEAFGKDEEFFEFYRTMQAYRKALGKSDTRLVLSPDSEFFKYFSNEKK